MKKITLSALLSLVFFGTAFSQSATRALKEADSFGKKGMSTINVYYGVNIFTGVYKSLAKNSQNGIYDLKYGSLGPVGIMYEYFVTDKIGIGAELGYTAYKISYSYDSYDSNGNPAVYKDTWNFNTIRAMGRINFHFTDDENFDGYGFLSAGYRNSNIKYSSTSPNSLHYPTLGSFVPFGMKPGLGLRYFFTDNVGLNIEIALGTPLLCGGLSAKF